jgi:protoporphyrin/coproporphyrin ferrochelatase
MSTGVTTPWAHSLGAMSYDALVLVSFGGPERPEDVIPFLENVTRGRNVPPERLAEVAGHYRHFGGVSPINQQNRELLAALEATIDLPLYWGNRNWHPMLEDTVRRMRDDGVRRALAFVTSAYGGTRRAGSTGRTSPRPGPPPARAPR